MVVNGYEIEHWGWVLGVFYLLRSITRALRANPKLWSYFWEYNFVCSGSYDGQFDQLQRALRRKQELLQRLRVCTKSFSYITHTLHISVFCDWKKCITIFCVGGAHVRRPPQTSHLGRYTKASQATLLHGPSATTSTPPAVSAGPCSDLLAPSATCSATASTHHPADCKTLSV